MVCRRRRKRKYGSIARVFRERIQAVTKIFRKTFSPFPCLSPANRCDQSNAFSCVRSSTAWRGTSNACDRERRGAAILFSDEARQNRSQFFYRVFRPQLPVGH